MRDIIIPGKRIKTELKWLLISFTLAVILNVYSIIRFDTKWSELITSLHILLLVSVVLYVVLLLLRGLASILMRLISVIRK